MGSEIDLSKLETRFSIHINRPYLYECAFTHSSVNGMKGTKHQDYERLEFLGDAVVGMVMGELCYILHPEMQEGRLSVLKAQFVRTESEAHFSEILGLEDFIRVGASYQGDIKSKANLLEDIFESFIGALFLDQGMEFAYNFLYKFLFPFVDGALIIESENPKSELQEAMQADHKESVQYKVVSESGPSHAKHFVSAVTFEGEEIGRGEGSSKKDAEIAAARSALAHMASAKVITINKSLDEPSLVEMSKGEVIDLLKKHSGKA